MAAYLGRQTLSQVSQEMISDGKIGNLSVFMEWLWDSNTNKQTRGDALMTKKWDNEMTRLVFRKHDKTTLN